MLKLKLLATAGCAAALLSACAADPYYDSPRYGPTYGSSPAYTTPAYTSSYNNTNTASMEYGRVVAIDVMRDGRYSSGHTSGAGAVIGGIVGGVIGHQIGSGRGNDAATVAGAVGGAVVGNNVERNNNRSGAEYYRVTVEFPDRRTATFAMDSLYGVRVGDRVRVEGDRLYRD
jgi:outer membrane lipoprotein SlyB